MRRSPRALVRSDWEAKLSHLEDLHARLAAVDRAAGQLADEATHDLVEALLWSRAAELRGSGLAAPPRSPWPWWPTCRAHAERLGSDRWMSIVTLAGRYLKLAGQPPPRRHLRAVQ